MKRTLLALSSLLFLPLLAVSCGGGFQLKAPEAARVIPGVPFYPQESYQCGPASLAGVLNYWGGDVSPGDVASAIYSRSAKGTLDIDLGAYAEKKGFRSAQYSGNWTDLRKNIDAGRPLLIMVDYGFWIYEQAHFMVVVGYDGDQGVIVNSGKEEHRYLPADRFLKTWEKTKSWTLLITRK